MKGELDRVIKVYVDHYDKRSLCGRFQFASQDKVQSFDSMMQLLISINDTMDQEKYPQAYDEIRRFHAPTAQIERSVESLNLTRGEVATFSLRILFRQHASWQGSIIWVEGNQEEFFRSVLELIMLIDNALSFTGKV